MNNRKDITTEEDIQLMVHRFYAQVRNNAILSPIFNPVVGDSWDHHLQVMCNFWSSMLLYTRKYLNDPMTKHLPLPLQPLHFEEWLRLFAQTIDAYFEGPLAEEAKRRATVIARLMQYTINAGNDK